MSSSQVLEVAIGLIFVYLLLSTACSGIKEITARLLDMRANTLEGAIRNMLADPGNEITSCKITSLLARCGWEPSRPTFDPGTSPSPSSLFDFVAP